MLPPLPQDSGPETTRKAFPYPNTSPNRISNRPQPPRNRPVAALQRPPTPPAPSSPSLFPFLLHLPVPLPMPLPLPLIYPRARPHAPHAKPPQTARGACRRNSHGRQQCNLCRTLHRPALHRCRESAGRPELGVRRPKRSTRRPAPASRDLLVAIRWPPTTSDRHYFFSRTPQRFGRRGVTTDVPKRDSNSGPPDQASCFALRHMGRMISLGRGTGMGIGRGMGVDMGVKGTGAGETPCATY